MSTVAACCKTAMRLDHVTIVASDCAPLRRFFVEIAGMDDGARPAFGVGGHWLYLDGQPALHLIEWRALLRRLRDSGTPYQLSDMRMLREQQLFVALAPDITVEFVITAHHLN